MPTTFGYPAFRRLFAAKIFSTFASVMQIVAAGWFVYSQTGSAAAVGVLGVLGLGPSLVGAPLGGLLADRYCPRRLSVLFSLLSMVGPLLLAGAAAGGALTVGVIYAGTLISAVPQAVAQPITQLIIPYAVPPHLRHRAVADISAGYGVAQLVGAVAGGALVQGVGPGAAFALNTVSYGINAWTFRRSDELQAACDMTRQDRSATLRSGISVAWGYAIVRMVIVGAVSFFALVAPLQQLMPTIAASHSGEAMLLGLLLAALGVGGLIANQFVRRWVGTPDRESTLLVGGLLLACVGSLVLSQRWGIAGDLACLVVIGFAWEMVFVSGRTAMQLEVPAALSGRLVGVFFLIVSGSAAAGALLMGWSFDAVGVDRTLLITAVVTALSAVVLGALRHRSQGVMPGPSMADLPEGTVPEQTTAR